MGKVLRARVLVSGEAEGVAAVSREPLSLWGGLSPETGEIIDKRHELAGQVVTGHILVLPSGRGSSTSSATLMESIKAGVAPAAIITMRVDPILALGAIVSDELYADPSHDAVKLQLQLPSEQITTDLEARTRAGVSRYCRGRLNEVNHEIHALRWRGLRALALATVALFVLIIASRLVYDEENLVRQVISEGLSIAAWVSFWVPLDMLIFKVWEQRLDRKIYTLLSEMEIVISPNN